MPIYIDIGVSAILLIAIIVGAIKGFAKQFTGGFCRLIGLIGSIGLTILIVPALQQAGALNGFSAAAGGWFNGEQFTTVIASEEDLINVLSDGFLKILSGLSPRIWSSMETYGMNTLGAYFGDLCARIIVGVIIWIVLLLLFKLLFFGIRKLLEKLTKLPVLNTLDRIFGVLWSLIATYIIFVSIIITAIEVVIIKWTPSVQPMLEEIVQNSTVFQVLHDTNIIGSYIAQLIGIDLSTIAPIM